MNRLQKKCVIGTAGIHLLLLLILVVGPAFFNREPKADSTILTVIPDITADDVPNMGVQNAQPPPPTPRTPPTPQELAPPPPIPQPQVQTPPPQPAPRIVQPDASFLDQVKKYFQSKPTPTVTPDLTPANKPQKSHPDNNIQVNTTMVKRKSAKTSQHSRPDNSQNTKAIQNTVTSLEKNLASGTTVAMPGASTTAVANYKDALATIYYNAWTTPNDAANDLADTKVRITVATDGTVISADIVTPSGDAKADASVRQALDSVSSVPPLPDQSKKQQQFIIDFNLKTKRMLE